MKSELEKIKEIELLKEELRICKEQLLIAGKFLTFYELFLYFAKWKGISGLELSDHDVAYLQNGNYGSTYSAKAAEFDALRKYYHLCFWEYIEEKYFNPTDNKINDGNFSRYLTRDEFKSFLQFKEDADALLLEKVKQDEQLHFDWCKREEPEMPNHRLIKGETEKDDLFSFSDYLNNNGKLLLPFLVEKYSGRKPKDIVCMLYALKDFKQFKRDEIPTNITELHRNLEKMFGGIGSRQQYTLKIPQLSRASKHDEEYIKTHKDIIKREIEKLQKQKK